MITLLPDQVIVLFLIYGDKFEKSGLGYLELIVRRMFPATVIDIVVIDNSLPESYVKHCDGYVRIGGNNTLWEFSGWDRGLDYIKENISCSRYAHVFFANDTFHQRTYRDGKNFLDVFDSPILKGKDVVKSAIGYLDDFPKDVQLCGIEYRYWIRSNIFSLPIDIVYKLYPFAETIDSQAVFSSDYEVFWSETDLISDNWKVYISSWLFGTENPKYPEYRLHWLKATSITADNYKFFKKKAKCILAEHYLSARLFDMKVPIIDTNIFDKKSDRHISAYYD